MPTNLDEMVETAAKVQGIGNDGVYGIGVRGSRSWATIHPGFLSAYANLRSERPERGLDDGMLSAAMNTDVSKETAQAKWVKMIQDSGASRLVDPHLVSGRYRSRRRQASAMIYDADILGYFMNGGDNARKRAISRMLRSPPIRMPRRSDSPNIWIWSLAMSQFSKQISMPPGTSCNGPAVRSMALFGATQMDFVNPVRSSRSGPNGELQKASEPTATPAMWKCTMFPHPARSIQVHRATAVLRPHHRMGRVAAEDGGQRSAGR